MSDGTKGHTPGPWHTAGGNKRTLIAAGSICVGAITSHAEDPAMEGANAQLSLRAPLAPHYCGDPECPGVRVLDILRTVAEVVERGGEFHLGPKGKHRNLPENLRAVLALIGDKP